MRISTEVSTKLAEIFDEFCIANGVSNACGLRWAVVKLLAEWQSAENGISIQYERWLKELMDAEKKQQAEKSNRGADDGPSRRGNVDGLEDVSGSPGRVLERPD